MNQKRVVAIHDISGLGKCSLTVALPVISAVGIETCVIPTAVLSTHTGGFTGYTFRDLSEDILPMARHWRSIGVTADAIYTGYLSSFEQIEMVEEIIELLRTEETIVAVDPVMADHGQLYANFSDAFPKRMRGLCAKADLIMPNITEASLMLEKPYQDGPYTQAYIEDMLHELLQIGAKQVVLTGVSFDENHLGAGCVTADGDISYSFTEKIPGLYHGTGDVFGSTLVAALVKGFALPDATDAAARYTCRCAKRTFDAGLTAHYGVNFEQEIPYLLDLLK